MHTLKLLFTLIIVSLTPIAFAQQTCPEIVNAALNAVDAACSGILRNQVCYGNIQLSATPREGISLDFEKSGDIADVVNLKTLELSSMSLTDQSWGVALMQLQANLPDTLPSQNVTLLLFGDVSISDANDLKVEIPVSATSGVNVRVRPSTSASVITALQNGQEVTAVGRLPDTSWIYVQLEDSSLGWVSGDFLKGELERLLVTEPDAPSFGPMQTFTFTSGIGDRPCEEAPDSGILIQTPQSAASVQMRVNNVDITFGSTLYIQAVPGDAMTVYVVEGKATLSANGGSQVVPSGTVSTVLLAPDGLASGIPQYPETYDSIALRTLPLGVLPELVTLELGIPVKKIPDAIDIANGLPPNGARWIHKETFTHIANEPCFPNDNAALGSVETNTTVITFNQDRSVMELPVPRTERLYRTQEGSYGGRGVRGEWSITFTSPTTYTGTLIGWPEMRECSFDSAIEGRYQR